MLLCYLEFAGDDDEIDLFEENEPFLEPAGSQPMINANQNTLENAVQKLEEVARELFDCWNRRQVKTKLQQATVEAFGQIHNPDSNPSGVQPSRAIYKCPVDTCESDQIRGDDIPRHFQKFGILKIVDDAAEYMSNLRKNKAGNVRNC